MAASAATIVFTVNGREIAAAPGETILAACQRHGIDIPHLCYQDGLRPDGNCRACVVEIKGERLLASSCSRRPAAGMVVRTDSERARRAQKLVLELLLANAPQQSDTLSNELRRWCAALGVDGPRFAPRLPQLPAHSHPAMTVNLAACIHCTRCLRACRESQVNDVIGYAYRGERSQIVFDLDDDLGESSCVACGECVQACPTGALMPAGGVGLEIGRPPGRHRLPLLRGRLPAALPRQGKPHPLRRGPARARQPRAALCQGTLRLRLRPPPPAPDQTADPSRRRPQAARTRFRPGKHGQPVSRGELGGSP